MSNAEKFLNNNGNTLNGILSSTGKKMLLFMHPDNKKLYAEYKSASDPAAKNKLCAQMLNTYEHDALVMTSRKFRCFRQDMKLYLKHHKDRVTIDMSDKSTKDYFSIAVILKNEARIIKEYILFYKAVGADRIYIYDNESDDNLLEVIDPFIKEGFVVYTKWPGSVVQTAAYRDAVKRTKGRTKWLAFVDSDEFLFPVTGDLKTLLKDYEDYPGLGVNWRVFGPNGHDKRPEGLMMDNYTECIENDEATINKHIKSIVQPTKVAYVDQVHYAVYKHGRFAVDERKEVIDNTCAFVPEASEAFTGVPNGEIFRINHYYTRSMEDLRIKCERGFPDGAPKGAIESYTRIFDRPLKQDYSIKRFADKVRADWSPDTLPTQQ